MASLTTGPRSMACISGGKGSWHGSSGMSSAFKEASSQTCRASTRSDTTFEHAHCKQAMKIAHVHDSMTAEWLQRVHRLSLSTHSQSETMLLQVVCIIPSRLPVKAGKTSPDSSHTAVVALLLRFHPKNTQLPQALCQLPTALCCYYMPAPADLI